MRKSILTAFLFFISFAGIAQDFSNKGTEFWLAYSYHVGMVNTGGAPAMTIYITSDVATSYTVEIYGGAVIQTGNITANQVIPVVIPNTYFVNADGLFTGRAIHVTALKPIVVYSFITRSQASAATLCLPANVLGKDYYAMSYEQFSNEQNASSYITIIAVEDNTNVEIRPTNGTKGGWAAGSVNVVTLNKGQVYQVLGNTTGTNGVDLSGTSVKSIASGTGGCKRIAVFSGSGKLALACTGGSADNLYQQLYPVSTWGKKYLTVPSYNRVTNFYRIMRSSTSAVVKLNGATIPAVSFTNGYYQFSTTTPNLIESDLPISVSQYFTSQGCLGNANPYDPDMIILNPVEQNINQVTLVNTPLTVGQAPPNQPHQHHIHVIMHNDAPGGTGKSSFTIDGISISPAAWVTHPQEPNYSYLYLSNVSQGNHKLYSDSGFNAVAYGYGSAETYAYSAGTNVKDLTQQLELGTQYGIESSPSTCINSPFRFKVYFPDSSTASPPVAVRFDSIDWKVSNPAIITPNNFNIRVINPTIDSTNIRNGRQVNWYSLPTLYHYTGTGYDTLTLTVYKSTSDGCGSTQDYQFPIQIFAPPVASFAATEPGCQLEPALFTETTLQTPKPTYQWYWDFGDGFISNSKNPSHTYVTPGTKTVRFASITTPGCLTDTVSQQIVIPDLPAAVITHNTDTVCINTTAPQLIFTGSQGKAPYEFSYSLNGVAQTPVNSNAGGTYSFTPPVNAAGQFIYKLTNVRNVGSTLCTTPVTGQEDTVTVLPDATVALFSAVGTNSQTLCINTAITSIVYDIGGSGNGGTVTGLPAGVNFNYNNSTKKLTITGTPSANGTFTYTINPAGPCAFPVPAVTGTITVTPDATINLSSATGSDDQTVCINNQLPLNIVYTLGGSATGVTGSGLPAGVTWTLSGNTITVQGIPSMAGVFNYTFTTAGPCVKPQVTGRITVTPNATVALASAAGTNNQTVCINNTIANIVYDIGGSGTGGTVAGLPTGVSFAYNNGTKKLTISGTPSQSGTFTYTINPAGPCAFPVPPVTGTITVTADATIQLTSLAATANQAHCKNIAIDNITYQIGGSATGVTVTGLPAGVTWSITGNIITISGTPTVASPAPYTYTITTTGPCVKPALTGSIKVHELPTANFTNTGALCETRDIVFTDNSNPMEGTLTNWSWNFGDPNASLPGNPNTSAATNPLHNYLLAGNYTVTLTVTTSNGCINTVPFTKTIVINNRPKAGFIVPEVCISDVAAIFIDTSKIASGGFSAAGYQWNYGDPGSGVLNTSAGVNGTHLYTSIGQYTVRHIVTSLLGCTDTAYNPIFINAADPAANFSVTNAAALCANDSVAIVNLSTISQGSVTKVEIYWDNTGAPAVFQLDDFPAFNKVYKHSYPNFQTPATKTYNIRLVAYSGTLCFNSKIIPVTINAAPKVQFNNMPAVCYYAPPFTITQASEVGGVPGTFAYSGPGIVNANGLFNSATAGIGTHKILYTFTSTAAGCVDTASRFITVIDTASAKFSFISPTCLGTSTVFKEESTAPAGVTLANTIWNFGDGSPSENHAPGTGFTHTYANWGNYTVSMYNTSAYGCRSASKQQQVYISPVPNTAFAFGQTSICIPNANVSFINNSTIADGTENAFTYLWNFGDITSGALNTSLAKTPQLHHYNGTGPYTVTLTVTSGTGCKNTITHDVNFIHPQPKTVFNFSKPGICIGDNVVMTDVTDGLDGTVTQWFWKFSDGGSASAKQVSYLFGVAGVFDVSLYTINSNGCNSDTLTKQFTVYPYPSVDAGPDRVVLEGGSIKLQPVVSGNLLQYLWTPNTYLDNDKTEQPTASNILDDITYTLTVTGEGGCTAPPDKMFVKVLKTPKVPNTFTPNGDGINDTWKIEYLDTYPNNRVQVFTRTGQLVFESKGYKTPWDGRMNGKPLPFDTYYYIIEPENGRKPVTGYVTIVK
jgi:gliding motility-associated-like protein